MYVYIYNNNIWTCIICRVNACNNCKIPSSMFEVSASLFCRSVLPACFTPQNRKQIHSTIFVYTYVYIYYIFHMWLQYWFLSLSVFCQNCSVFHFYMCTYTYIQIYYLNAICNFWHHSSNPTPLPPQKKRPSSSDIIFSAPNSCPQLPKYKSQVDLAAALAKRGHEWRFASEAPHLGAHLPWSSL